MGKSEYKTRWYEYIIQGIISLLLSLAILFKWFSLMIGDRKYSEIGSSKTSGLAYSVAKLEQSNWRYVLVIIFLFISISFFRRGYLNYKNKN